MFRKMAIVFCIFSLVSLSAFAETTQDQTMVDLFMQNLIKSYVKRDVSTLIQFYHPNAIVIGTGKGDIFKGQKNIMAAFKQDFAQSAGSTIKLQKIATTVIGSVALVAYDVDVDVKVKDSAPFKTQLRFSLALVKEGNRWWVMQSHLSAPLVDQKANDSFPKTTAS